MDSLSVTPQHAPQLSPDEQKLLAKLEEQNRLLETDSKSLYSVNGVLRSPCSSKIFSFEESSSSWSDVVQNWDEWSKKKVKQLKALIRKGIPPHVRASVWQMLCNSHTFSVQEKYSELLQKQCPCEKLIQRDLNRLLPHHPLFQSLHVSIQQALCNMLKAYSILDGEVGYHQGSIFIVGLLLMQMSEVEAFGVYLRLMQDFRLRELYRPHMIELGCCVFQFEGLIQEQLPKLYSHFQTHAFNTSTFSSPWFLTLFISCLPLTAARRVFDIFLCEGLEIVFRVGMAILQLTQNELLQLDTEGLALFLEKTAPQQMDNDPDRMIKTAYQIKFDSKRMKKLEKEYTTIKMKEMEEQEEMKKLLSENKVLRQRIDTLEKRFDEDAVWRLGQECVRMRLRNTEQQQALKQMEIKMLLMEKSSTIPDEGSAMNLNEQLLSGKLREAETLTALREIRQHIKDIEEMRQTQQKGSRLVDDVQDELMRLRLSEIQSQIQLSQNRHRLLQLQIQDQTYGLQLKRIAERVHSQSEHLQELTMQNQCLRSQLGQTTKEQHLLNLNSKDEKEEDTAVVRKLQHQIAQLQARIGRISRQKEDTRL
ncbi:ecotropic viral integration site 5 protein homolog [Hoplias malabaricus]|uniref:ecotropic viral integration site 5 protein homolog n=1 Tax=Hoplias malabaricus TaxID=27720 RepID=UPI0034618978